MNRKKISLILNAIATEIQNSDRNVLNDLSLGSGLSGDTLFLYQYGSLMRNQPAALKAEDLTKQIFVNHHFHSLYPDPFSFFGGIKGLVSTFSHVNAQFIDLDFYKVFKDIDEFVRSRILYQTIELNSSIDKGLIGTGLYLLGRERLKEKAACDYTDDDVRICETMIVLIDGLSYVLKTNPDDIDFLSNCFLFINKVQPIGIYPELIETLASAARTRLQEHFIDEVEIFKPTQSLIYLCFSKFLTESNPEKKLAAHSQFVKLIDKMKIEDYINFDDSKLVIKSMQLFLANNYFPSPILEHYLDYLVSQILDRWHCKDGLTFCSNGIFGRAGVGLFLCSILTKKTHTWERLVNL